MSFSNRYKPSLMMIVLRGPLCSAKRDCDFQPSVSPETPAFLDVARSRPRLICRPPRARGLAQPLAAPSFTAFTFTWFTSSNSVPGMGAGHPLAGAAHPCEQRQRRRACAFWGGVYHFAASPLLALLPGGVVLVLLAGGLVLALLCSMALVEH